MRAEAGEQWQLLAAHEHVDGVDLDDADAFEHLPQVAAVDPSGRAWVGEALCGDSHSPRLVGRQRDGFFAVMRSAAPDGCRSPRPPRAGARCRRRRRPS